MIFMVWGNSRPEATPVNRPCPGGALDHHDPGRPVEADPDACDCALQGRGGGPELVLGAPQPRQPVPEPLLIVEQP